MRSSSGFTLVELLVSIALTGIVIISLLSFFIAFIGHQVRSQDERAALETVRFLFADLSRELYFGHDYGCGDGETAADGSCTCLVFSDQLGRRVKVLYASDDERVDMAVNPLDPNPNTCDSSADSFDTWVPFTDDSVSIINLAFYLEDTEDAQPRVKMYARANYELEGVTKTVSFKTQVTGRILEPSGDLLEDFIIGSETEGITSLYYFVFALDTDDTFVCKDESGTSWQDSFCQEETDPVAVEFTDDGLYLLGSNGLLFYIPRATIVDTALQATGSVGGNNAVDVDTFELQNALLRVLGEGSGSDPCRLCDDDPRNIVSLHPLGSYLYAKGANGSLYIVDEGTANRIVDGAVDGAIGKKTVLHIDTDSTGSRIFMLFRDATGKRLARLFSGDASLSGTDIFIDSCSGFSYVPGSSPSTCRQLHPASDSEGSVTPPSALETLPFSFLKRLQVINNTVSLWYRDAGTPHTLSIGSASSSLDRTDPDLIAKADAFVYGGGLTKYTAVCDGGVKLCVIDSIIDATVETVEAVEGVVFADHIHMQGFPVGISESGRIIYTSVISDGVSQTDTAVAFPVYNEDGVAGTNEARVLCDAVVDDGQQVTFSYLSDRGEDANLAALIGRSFGSGGSVREIYVLEPTTSSKEQFGLGENGSGELADVCTNERVERYHLPTELSAVSLGPSDGLDLLRFRGLRLVEPVPTP